MSLQTQKWLSTFEEQLYPDNTFYQGCKNDSAYASNLTVHIPNYSAEPTVFSMSGSVSYPRTIKELAHTEMTYNMLQVGVDPYLVDPLESEEFSFDKRKAVLSHQVNKLNDYVGFKIAWEWAAGATDSGTTIQTSGSTTRSNRFGTTVKRLVYSDLVKAQTMLNNQNVPVAGRRLVVDAYMYEDILNFSELQGSASLVNASFTDGAILKVLGFDVYLRSEMPSYSSGATIGTKKAIGAADIVTDLSCALAFHPDYVRYAVGTKENSGIKIFIERDNAAVYGDIMSMYTRVGAAHSYYNHGGNVTGVITIVEND